MSVQNIIKQTESLAANIGTGYSNKRQTNSKLGIMTWKI